MSDVVKGVAFVAAGLILGPVGFGFVAGWVANAAIAVGLSIVSSQLFAPKIPHSPQRLAERQTTVRTTTAYRTIVYGEAMVSGPIAYHNLSGENGEDAWYVIALAHGESESVEAVWLDGHEIDKAFIEWTPGVDGADGTGSGDVQLSQWQSDDDPPVRAVRLYWALGHDDQQPMSVLDNAFTDWGSQHRARGLTYGVARFRYVAGTETIWEEYGQPSDIKFVLKGRKVYDPRRYALNADNTFQTIALPFGGGAKWFDDSDHATAIDDTYFSTLEAYGTTLLRYNGSTSAKAVSERIPIADGGRYSITVTARTIAADGNNNFGVYFYDAAGALISSASSPASDATGWDSISAAHYWDTNVDFPISPGTYTFGFGNGETATIPSGAVEMALLWQPNFANEASVIDDIYDYAVYETNGIYPRNLTDDKSTWQWSDNPPLCLADYLTQIMGVGANRINWQDITDTAQAYDELVDIPPVASPQTTEKRFTCNGAISLGDSHKANIEKILSSGDMQLRWKEGQWSVRPSVWEDATVTIDEDWLTDEGIEVLAMDGEKDRFNTVRGFYIDPEREYQPVEFPQVQVDEYVTRDGRELTRDLELPMTNTHTMAQRIAYRIVEQGDNQTIAKAKLNAKAMQLAIGDPVLIDWWPLGWTAGGNYIPNSADVSSFEKGNATVLKGGVNPFGAENAYTVTISTTSGSDEVHFPDPQFPGPHFPDHFAGGTGGGGGGNTELYVDLDGFAASVNTLACWYRAGTMTTQFITVAVVNRSSSPNAVILKADLDLTDGSLSNQTGEAGNSFRVDHYPFGYYRVIAYLQAGLIDNDDLRFYLMYDATATEGDTFRVYGPQAVPAFNLNPLYIETTGTIEATQPKSMRVITWKPLEDGRFEVTFRQDEEADYDDPLVAEYSVYDNGAITEPTITVSEPTNLTATAQPGRVKWEWDDPPSRLYDVIEVWTSDTNDRSTATLTASVKRSPFIQDNVTDWKTTYAWVRARNYQYEFSEWEPVGSTSGVDGIPDVMEATLGLPDPDFLLSDTFPNAYWYERVRRDGSVGASPGPSWLGTITLQEGLGVGGTNAMDISLCNLSNSLLIISTVAKLRLPFGGAQVRVRYKATSGFNGDLTASLTAYDSVDNETSVGGAVGNALTWDSSPPKMIKDGQWHTATWTLYINRDLDSRLVRVSLRALQVNYGQDTINDYARIDYIQIYPVEASAGPVLEYD